MLQLHKGAEMEHIPAITERQHSQLNNWWKALWNYIRKLFGLKTAYQRSAYNIMNLKLEGLKQRVNELGSDARLYALDSNNWNELFSDKQVGNTKYRYFRTTTQAEEYANQAQVAFGSNNVAVSPKQGNTMAKVIIKNPDYKEITRSTQLQTTAENNYKELNKEGANITGKGEVLTNFVKYYPALDYMNEMEREAFVDALSTGEIEQIC